MARSSNSNHVAGRLRPWILEIAATFSSIALLVALVVVLAYFDQKAIFDTGIATLNSIISVLSTASKAMLLFAIANAISQWNWILFAASPRRLYDFERVTDASRGPFGSVRLLWNTNFRGG